MLTNILHDGITPAWAGKRLAPAPTWVKSQDHPRVGGEKAAPVWRR